MMSIHRSDIFIDEHAIGMEFVRQGDYMRALPYLRSAWATEKSSITLANDLGVTLMRLKLFNEAKDIFLGALRSHPLAEILTENLRVAEQYIAESTPVSQPHILHNLMCLRRIRSQHIPSHRQGIESLLHHPFLVPSAIDLRARLVQPLQFKRRYAYEKVDFYANNMNFANVYPTFTSLQSALQQMRHYVKQHQDVDYGRSLGVYMQWNLDVSMWNNILHDANITLPDFIHQDDRRWLCDTCLRNNEVTSKFYRMTHWKMLLIGSRNSGMFNHQDTLRTSSWQLQLHGSKRWHLCSPTQNAYLYDAGDVNMFSPDYTLFPVAINATCFDVIVKPGDIIYYPEDYWHQTKNIDAYSISLSSSIVTPHNWKLIKNELQAECNGAGRVFARDEEVCNSLGKCYASWQRDFESGKKEQ